MNFFTHTTTDSIPTNGTYLQGHLNISYNKLVGIFGQPAHYGGCKSDVQWSIYFDDGTVATIYDYKNPKLPIYIKKWHVGGHSLKALRNVEKMIDSHSSTD